MAAGGAGHGAGGVAEKKPLVISDGRLVGDWNIHGNFRGIFFRDFLGINSDLSGWWWLEPWNFTTFHSVGNGIIIPTVLLLKIAHTTYFMDWSRHHTSPFLGMFSIWVFVTFNLQPEYTSPGWWFGTWILWLSIQLGISSSQLTNSYFSEGLKPPISCYWKYPIPHIEWENLW